MKPGHIVLSILVFLAMIALFMMVNLALSHELFRGLVDPETKKGCCNEGDCKRVPDAWLATGAITPYANGYRIRITLEQARYFNKNMREPVDALFPAERVLWVLPYPWAICLNPSDESAMPAYSGHRVRCLLGMAMS